MKICTLTIQHGKYAVYAHFINGSIFYVGSGSTARPFAESRNNQWAKIVKGGGGTFEIGILGWFDTARMALAYEREMIKKYHPRGNLAVPKKNPKILHGPLASANADPVDVAGEIRHRREISGLTWQELADRCGVQGPTAQAWGNGRSRPSLGKLKLLDEIFEIEIPK